MRARARGVARLRNRRARRTHPPLQAARNDSCLGHRAWVEGWWWPQHPRDWIYGRIVQYTTKPLTAETWADFAALVEAHNGVWGGCWCMGFHPEGVGPGHTSAGNREAKRAHTMAGTVHQILVYADDECVGWCQYGTPAELPNIQNRKTYDLAPVEAPRWRIGCIFTASKHRGQGVARAAVGGALEAIARAGGGVE